MTTAHIDAGTVRGLLASHPETRLIDVRTPGEFAAAHIPGSSNVPLTLLRELRDEIRAEHADPVVLVCASGARAEQARAMLDRAGMERLQVLRGGMTDWQRDGGEVSEGHGTWAMERQVRLAAGSLVVTGVLGSLRYRPLIALAGAIGAGLTFSAISNTCGMARMLALLPYNRRGAPDAAVALDALT
ncbi:sulfurtransferase [Actinomycetospora sp. NBRC 106375]|uniref:rhodanese-like domain-containing protein n=1 Tax=Actinomycetospora sp. NBRC 106375 TaxID=3032207 RepID=UPI0024A2688E|nr:rhodanese-like domain-containing protein [Actinomycetospora sp. NBRC 106375]GLZ49769.1 sulfurtransferase [Actinomycetospora sp. NBRC 106375]